MQKLIFAGGVLVSAASALLILSAPAEAAARCEGQRATIVGSRGPDVILGTDGRDVIIARGGGDRIYGRGGPDVICGGKGNDQIFGQAGRDRIAGGSGRDRIDGGGRFAATTDYEVLQGGSGNDVIRGSGGRDLLVGNGGDDRLFGEEHGDLIRGGGGNDYIETSEQSEIVTYDTAYGGRGDDEIVSLDRGADKLVGGPGHDVLTGGARSFDEMIGGPGDDRMRKGFVSYAGSSGGVIVDLTSGSATGEGDDLVVKGEGVRGSSFDDVIVGSEGADLLLGGPGDDSLEGRGGPDRIYAGVGLEEADDEPAGTDRLRGDDGNDILYDIGRACADATACGAEADDTFDGGAGVDQVYYEAPVGVVVDLAQGSASGAGADLVLNIENVHGTDNDDRLSGDDAANLLDAGAGRDRLEGRGGNDELIEGGSAVSGKGEGDVFYGGPGDDQLSVFYGSNELRGGPGNDTLDGGSGPDRLFGEEDDDNLVGSLGDDLMDGGAGADTAQYHRLGEVRVDLQSGTGEKPGGSDPDGFGVDTVVSIENVVGSGGHDVLIGDDETNRLEGGRGSDDIRGAGGDDHLDGGEGGILGRREPDHDTLDGGDGTDTCINGETDVNCEL